MQLNIAVGSIESRRVVLALATVDREPHYFHDGQGGQARRIGWSDLKNFGTNPERGKLQRSCSTWCKE